MISLTDGAKNPIIDTELVKIWPRFTNINNGVPKIYQGFGLDTATGQNVVPLDGNQCLVLFLGGYVYENFNTTTPTKYSGFTTIPASPFSDPPLSLQAATPPPPPSGKRQGPFIDIQPKKIDQYGHYLDPWGTPYAYFSSKYGNDYVNWQSQGVAFPGGSIVRPYKDSATKYSNQGLFQIICAGPDKSFGPGTDQNGNSLWTPALGFYSAKAPPGPPTPANNNWGWDDLSNFRDASLGIP
jgi:hypothetical protein